MVTAERGPGGAAPGRPGDCAIPAIARSRTFRRSLEETTEPKPYDDVEFQRGSQVSAPSVEFNSAEFRCRRRRVREGTDDPRHPPRDPTRREGLRGEFLHRLTLLPQRRDGRSLLSAPQEQRLRAAALLEAPVAWRLRDRTGQPAFPRSFASGQARPRGRWPRWLTPSESGLLRDSLRLCVEAYGITSGPGASNERVGLRIAERRLWQEHAGGTPRGPCGPPVATHSPGRRGSTGFSLALARAARSGCVVAQARLAFPLGHALRRARRGLRLDLYRHAPEQGGCGSRRHSTGDARGHPDPPQPLRSLGGSRDDRAGARAAQAVCGRAQRRPAEARRCG